MAKPTDTVGASKQASWGKIVLSVIAVAIGIPLQFYLRFGFVDGYAYGFTAFLILMMLAVELIPRHADPVAGEAPYEYVRSRWDFLGVVWLLSIPFAPLLGWLASDWATLDEHNWRALFATRAVLCVIVPIVGMLSLLRFVRRPHVGFMLAVLFLGTAYPVLTALDATIDVIRGPAWQDVNITDFKAIDFSTRAGTRVNIDKAFVFLDDGRTLRRGADVKLERGPAHLLVLVSSGRIIGAR